MNNLISLITNQKILLNLWVSQSKRYNVGIEGDSESKSDSTLIGYYTYDQYLQFKGINTENDNRQIVIMPEYLQKPKR